MSRDWPVRTCARCGTTYDSIGKCMGAHMLYKHDGGHSFVECLDVLAARVAATHEIAALASDIERARLAHDAGKSDPARNVATGQALYRAERLFDEYVHRAVVKGQ